VTEITKANLEEVGYRVSQAASAAEALRLLKTNQRFDVLFSDIVMPGDANGLDLARAIREERPEVSVLLATGYSAVAQTAVDEGFLVLRKPYDTHALVEALRSAIRSTRFRVVA
jgi:two-component system NtrC family sensor kinase